ELEGQGLDHGEPDAGPRDRLLMLAAAPDKRAEHRREDLWLDARTTIADPQAQRVGAATRRDLDRAAADRRELDRVIEQVGDDLRERIPGQLDGRGHRLEADVDSKLARLGLRTQQLDDGADDRLDAGPLGFGDQRAA